MSRSADAARIALATAKADLDRLGLYASPVRIDRVRVVTAPWLFRWTPLRRFDGYALRRTILLRRPARVPDPLVTHELCHIWQQQHHPLRMPLSYLRYGYRRNPFERQARAAAAATAGHRGPVTGPAAATPHPR